jgi:protein dithiol:quinone oxidoreductase
MISSRALFGIGVAVCVLLLSIAYYLQYFAGQDPCPLCLVQRGFFYVVGAVFLVGALHGRGVLAYSIAGFVAALGGLAVAARHVWLQYLPADRVPACGPDLFYMLENFPLQRTLEKLFTATGQCAEVKWRLLGLSIAEWSLLWFGVLAIYALWIGFTRRSPRQSLR